MLTVIARKETIATEAIAVDNIFSCDKGVSKEAPFFISLLQLNFWHSV